jgi:site-specific DNA recombinase
VLQELKECGEKLLQVIDRLDSGDKHYDQKYQDMSDRLDNLYDRISELDEEIAGVDARIQAAYEKQITGKTCINSFWILIHYMRG